MPKPSPTSPFFIMAGPNCLITIPLNHYEFHWVPIAKTWVLYNKW